jgi:hypothetical protein
MGVADCSAAKKLEKIFAKFKQKFAGPAIAPSRSKSRQNAITFSSAAS